MSEKTEGEAIVRAAQNTIDDAGRAGQAIEAAVTETLTLVLSTLRQAEAEGLTLAEGRQRVEAELGRRFGLEPAYLAGLVEEVELVEVIFSFDTWLNQVADAFPAGTAMPASVEELRGWYEEGHWPAWVAREISRRMEGVE